MLIMVVDDEPDIQMLFEQRFRKEIRSGELQFRFAFSGSEALEVLNSSAGTDLVLILSDINMPGMSGLELLREIKGHRPGIPVFMITAYDDQEKYREAMDCGANDYLAKPLDFGELKEKILSVRKTS
ncbi:MAG: response regulator [Candidatus Hydrogenedentes bacterium]|nr:response regulator [Candidatus Hydrogenedentota bacterium]